MLAHRADKFNNYCFLVFVCFVFVCFVFVCFVFVCFVFVCFLTFFSVLCVYCFQFPFKYFTKVQDIFYMAKVIVLNVRFYALFYVFLIT